MGLFWPARRRRRRAVRVGVCRRRRAARSAARCDGSRWLARMGNGSQFAGARQWMRERLRRRSESSRGEKLFEGSTRAGWSERLGEGAVSLPGPGRGNWVYDSGGALSELPGARTGGRASDPRRPHPRRPHPRRPRPDRHQHSPTGSFRQRAHKHALPSYQQTLSIIRLVHLLHH
ncbi:hypothetical protein VTI74DRAFT_10909 [Chaetomium olivicolor]